MASHRKQLFIALAFILFAIVWAPAQSERYLAERFENGVSEPWFMDSNAYTREEAVAAVSRWKSIEADVKSAGGGAWAGAYFVGDETHGSYLSWSEKSGFVLLHVDKCAARVMDFSYGKVSVSPEMIVLVPERMAKQTSGHGGPHEMATKYIPAVWRGAHYLVEENRIAAFGDYVAGLGEFNVGLNPSLWIEGNAFFYRLGDTEEELGEGAPVVPAVYQRFMKMPIEASIVGVGRKTVRRIPTVGGDPYYESGTFVTINVGRAGGLRPGMIMRVRDSVAKDVVRILRVRESSALGEIIRDLDDDRNEIYYEWTDDAQHQKVPPSIVAGWRVTTL